MRHKPASNPKKSSDPEEYKRFLKVAREVGAYETLEGAESAFKKVVPVKKLK